MEIKDANRRIKSVICFFGRRVSLSPYESKGSVCFFYFLALFITFAKMLST